MNRILRGLSSRRLPCGCLVGIYETYDGRVVSIIDARGEACHDRTHDLGRHATAEDHESLRASA